MSAATKRIVIIAGPNGAGKTAYRTLVDSWIVYDTAGPQPVPLASGDNR